MKSARVATRRRFRGLGSRDSHLDDPAPGPILPSVRAQMSAPTPSPRTIVPTTSVQVRLTAHEQESLLDRLEIILLFVPEPFTFTSPTEHADRLKRWREKHGGSEWTVSRVASAWGEEFLQYAECIQFTLNGWPPPRPGTDGIVRELLERAARLSQANRLFQRSQTYGCIPRREVWEATVPRVEDRNWIQETLSGYLRSTPKRFTAFKEAVRAEVAAMVRSEEAESATAGEDAAPAPADDPPTEKPGTQKPSEQSVPVLEPAGPFEDGSVFGIRWGTYQHLCAPNEHQAWQVLRQTWPPAHSKESLVDEVRFRVGSTAGEQWGTNTAGKVRKILDRMKIGFTFNCVKNTEGFPVFRWERV